MIAGTDLQLDRRPEFAQIKSTLLELTNDGVLHYATSQIDDAGNNIVTGHVQQPDKTFVLVTTVNYRVSSETPNTITLTQLQVQPAFQEQGFGKRAVGALIKAAVDNGYTSCDAVTIAASSSAWTVPLQNGANETGPGKLTFELNDADAFFSWLMT